VPVAFSETYEQDKSNNEWLRVGAAIEVDTRQWRWW